MMAGKVNGDRELSTRICSIPFHRLDCCVYEYVRVKERERERERGEWCILRERLRKKRGERKEESERKENGVSKERERKRERR
jgi:hypothetical protein